MLIVHLSVLGTYSFIVCPSLCDLIFRKMGTLRIFRTRLHLDEVKIIHSWRFLKECFHLFLDKNINCGHFYHFLRKHNSLKKLNMELMTVLLIFFWKKSFDYFKFCSKIHCGIATAILCESVILLQTFAIWFTFGVA